MGCGDRVLELGEDLLVELLPRSETGVLYPDVPAGDESCEFYHPPREVVYPDGLPHVEDEDLVARAYGRGLHDEAACLGDGHEEARDVGVRDRDRPSPGYLLLEPGYD